MKILDTSAAIGGNIEFLKIGHFDFLQLAYKEIVAADIISQIGPTYSTSTVYVLYGCVTGTSGGNTTFTAGAIFYNGEVFLSPMQTIVTPSGGNIVVANLFVSQYTTNADPTDFSDGTPRNVCNIRTVAFAAGASGSGTISGTTASDFVNLAQIPRNAAWTQAGTPVISAVQHGSAAIPTTTYNGYKVNGKTFFWTIDCTLTNSATSTLISINYPIAIVPVDAYPSLGVPFQFLQTVSGTTTMGIGYINQSGIILDITGGALTGAGINLSIYFEIQ